MEVSVVIAAYNRSDVLFYAIQSVLWQTFQDFEIVVVGDHCTDDSKDVVNSFGQDRIRWHNLPSNVGQAGGPNNKGIELARGKYIAYLGQDDIWLPNHLEALVAGGDCDFAHTVLVCISPPDVKFPRRDLHGLYSAGATKIITIPPSCVMHKKEACEKIGYWKCYKTIAETPDQEFISRFYNQKMKINNAKELTVFKFPASWRRNCYLHKSCEQAEYFDKLSKDMDNFLSDKRKEIIRFYKRNQRTVNTEIDGFLSNENFTEIMQDHIDNNPKCIHYMHGEEALLTNNIKPGESVTRQRIYRGLPPQI